MTTACRAAGATKMLMNPAPAISILSTRSDCRQRGDERLRELARIRLQRLRVLQCDVRCEVAVLRLLRTVELDIGGWRFRRNGGHAIASATPSAGCADRSWGRRIIAACPSELRPTCISRESERIDIEAKRTRRPGSASMAARHCGKKALHRAPLESRARAPVPARVPRVAAMRRAPARTLRRAPNPRARSGCGPHRSPRRGTHRRRRAAALPP